MLFSRTFRAAVVIAAGLAAASTAQAQAHDYMAGSLKIHHPWTRVTPDGAQAAGGFMTITNTGADTDTLVGGTFVLSAKFEIHEMSMTDGVMKMRQLEKGIVIKPGETVELKPGGLHTMLIGLKQPLRDGEKVKGTLVFEKAGTVEVDYKVEPLGTRAPGSAGHDHGSAHAAPKKVP
jgi:periplasmic copper chaperone A